MVERMTDTELKNVIKNIKDICEATGKRNISIKAEELLEILYELQEHREWFNDTEISDENLQRGIDTFIWGCETTIGATQAGYLYNALCELQERRMTDKYSCDSIKKDENGKCVGYQKSDIDDEPAKKCMECSKNVFYEDHEQDILEYNLEMITGQKWGIE